MAKSRERHTERRIADLGRERSSGEVVEEDLDLSSVLLLEAEGEPVSAGGVGLKLPVGDDQGTKDGVCRNEDRMRLRMKMTLRMKIKRRTGMRMRIGEDEDDREKERMKEGEGEGPPVAP